MKRLTNDLKVGNGRNPVLVADFMLRPTFRPDGRVERAQITDREESAIRYCVTKSAADSRITLGEETETTNNVSLAVSRQRRQGISLKHPSYRLEFPLCLAVGLLVDPFLSCLPWQIRLIMSFVFY